MFKDVFEIQFQFSNQLFPKTRLFIRTLFINEYKIICFSFSSPASLSPIIQMIPLLYAYLSSANCPICLPLPLIVPVVANETFTPIPFSSIWLTSSLPLALMIIIPINYRPPLPFFLSSSKSLLWSFLQRHCNKQECTDTHREAQSCCDVPNTYI